MVEDTKTKLLGLIIAGMDGRDQRGHIEALDGNECIEAHNVLKITDDLLKARWTLMGSPAEHDIL